jgi:predicted phosphohydrolase
MKMQIASDLHLEFQRDIDDMTKIITPSDADVLILAGDIGYPESPETRKFLEWACGVWKDVVLIFGNHEYYNADGSSLSTGEKEALVPDIGNLHFLNRSEIRIGGVHILGATLWTEIPDTDRRYVERSMSDFQCIKDFTLDEWTRRHNGDRAWLETRLDELSAAGESAVVVTHHLPTHKIIPPKYRSYNNSSFASHCDYLVQKPAVKLWVCGHSHGHQMDGRVVLNARGYPGESTGYNPSLVVTLP